MVATVGGVRFGFGWEKGEEGGGRGGGAVCVFFLGLSRFSRGCVGDDPETGRQRRQGGERTEPDCGYSALLKITEETGDGIRNRTMRHHQQHRNQPHHDKPAAAQGKLQIFCRTFFSPAARRWGSGMPATGNGPTGGVAKTNRNGARGDGEDTVGGVWLWRNRLEEAKTKVSGTPPATSQTKYAEHARARLDLMAFGWSGRSKSEMLSSIS